MSAPSPPKTPGSLIRSSAEACCSLPFDGRHRLFADERERNIIRNIVDLAGVFGARVCVEGIETAAMRDILREFRVKSFQGYYYAKPLPPEKMMDD